MQEVVEDLSPLADPDSSWNLDGEWFAKTFRDQLGIYGSYWRDDPQFDVTHTLRAAPHLPCPRLDRATMSRLARFAIDANFGRVASCQARAGVRRPEPPARLLHDPSDWRSHGEMPNGDPRIAHLGHRGRWSGRRPMGTAAARWPAGGHRRRRGARSTAVFHVHSATFSSLVHGELSVSQAVRAGQVRIEGNGMDRRRLEAVLQAAATASVEWDNCARPGTWRGRTHPSRRRPGRWYSLASVSDNSMAFLSNNCPAGVGSAVLTPSNFPSCTVFGGWATRLNDKSATARRVVDEDY